MMSSAGDRTDIEDQSGNLDCWLTKPIKQVRLYEALAILADKPGAFRTGVPERQYRTLDLRLVWG
jgi:hypothetical protein